MEKFKIFTSDDKFIDWYNETNNTKCTKKDLLEGKLFNKNIQPYTDIQGFYCGIYVDLEGYRIYELEIKEEK